MKERKQGGTQKRNKEVLSNNEIRKKDLIIRNGKDFNRKEKKDKEKQQ